MGGSSRIWVIGGVLIALAIVGGGYLIGVSPALEAAALADQRVEQVEDNNEVQRAEIERLKKLDAEKETIAAELAVLQKSIPAAHQLSPYDGRLVDYAAAADVKVIEIAYDEAEFNVTPVDADADAAADAAGLVAMPVKLTMEAKPRKLITWLKELQYGERFFAIKGMSVESQNRANKDTTLRWTVNGYIFVLPDTKKDTEIANGGTETPDDGTETAGDVN